jgi:hypothetical protein
MVSDMVMRGSFALNDSNQYVAYLNSNDSKRNLTDNWFDNDWNASTHFLLVRNFVNVSGNSLY